LIKKDDQGVIEGVLNCSHADCQLEYPVIDGIPIIVPNIRKYVADNLYHISVRDDLSETIESMVGDCLGAGTNYDASRQHLSSYTWGHYGDLDSGQPQVPGRSNAAFACDLISCLHAGLELLETAVHSPIIDIGCAVGRTSFELAEKYDALVLGVDLNFSMLRVAQKILRNEPQAIPIRRVGLVYEHRVLDAWFAGADRVDFWACDAMALPFPNNSFGLVTTLNVLDSVASPHELLVSVNDSLKTSGWAVLACPYDWSSAVTPMEGWIGGHSQRGATHGAPEPLLRSLLTPGAHPLSLESLQLKGEIDNQVWTVRHHDRSYTEYNVHIVTVQKGNETLPAYHTVAD